MGFIIFWPPIFLTSKSAVSSCQLCKYLFLHHHGYQKPQKMKNNSLSYLCTIGLRMIFLSCSLALPTVFNRTITVTYRKVVKSSTDAALAFRNETPKFWLYRIYRRIGVWLRFKAGKFAKELKRTSGMQPKSLVTTSFEAGFLILIFNAHFSFLAWHPRVQHSCYGL